MYIPWPAQRQNLKVLYPCYICGASYESLKACKNCSNFNIDHQFCENCTEIEGGFIKKCLFMGRRFCHNCIIVITESEIENNRDITFKDFYKKQKKCFKKQNKSKKFPAPKEQGFDIIDDSQDVIVPNIVDPIFY